MIYFRAGTHLAVLSLLRIQASHSAYARRKPCSWHRVNGVYKKCWQPSRRSGIQAEEFVPA